MYSYKCDHCGRRINVDPGDIRLCDQCQRKDAEQTRKIVYQGQKKACYAS